MPFTYYHCPKAIRKNKKLHLNASRCLEQKDKAHFLDLALFDDLAGDSEIVPTRPRGAPLLT